MGFHTYPNPTNSNFITVEFNLNKSGDTKIQLYDLSGRIEKNIDNQLLEAGNHRYELDISGLINGQYNLIIESVGSRINHKIMINR